MKKILLVLIFTAVSAGFLFAGNGTTVIIKNETGYSLNYIYFSPSAFDDWGDDFLGDSVLEDGGEAEIILDREIDVDENLYDLQAVDEDDDYYTMYEVDITETPVISITMEAYDGGDYDGYDDYDYSGYEEGYNDGYSEGYKQGYIDAFRDAYLEGFRAAREMDVPVMPDNSMSGNSGYSGSDSWR